jgi:hypothetical protein
MAIKNTNDVDNINKKLSLLRINLHENVNSLKVNQNESENKNIISLTSEINDIKIKHDTQQDDNNDIFLSETEEQRNRNNLGSNRKSPTVFSLSNNSNMLTPLNISDIITN